jgi:alanyl aminopeptidase
MAWLANAARSREPAVGRAAVDLAHFLRANAVADEDLDAFDAFTVRAFAPRARALGLVPRPGESDDDALQRRGILMLVGPHDPALAAAARRLARAWLDDPRAVDASLVEPVLSVAAHAGDAALFDALLEKALEARTVAARREALVALFSFRDPVLAARAAALLRDERFDARDLFPAFRASVRDRDAAQRAQQVIAEHFDALAKRASPDAPAWWPWYVEALCGEPARKDFEAFWRDRAARYPGAERNVSQVADRIGRCGAVRDAQRSSVRAALARASRK